VAKFWVRKFKNAKKKEFYFLFFSSYSLPTSSFQPIMVNSSDIPYNLMNYNSSEIPSSFMFQDMNNYQNQKDFNGEI